MYALLVPEEEKDQQDLSKVVQHGPFRHFPHYPTTGGNIDHQKANALADLTGWSILNNKELFERIVLH